MSDKDFMFDETAPLTGDTDFLEIDELTDTIALDPQDVASAMELPDGTASMEPLDETDTIGMLDETAPLEMLDETAPLDPLPAEKAAETDLPEDAAEGPDDDSDLFSDDDFWSDDELYSDTAPMPGLADYDADETAETDGGAAAVMNGAAAMAARYSDGSDAARKGGLSEAISKLYDDDAPPKKPDLKAYYPDKDKEKEDKGPSAFSIFAGKAGNVLSYVIPAVLILVILVSGFLFLRDLLEYKRADDIYKELDAYITEPEEPAAVPDVPAETTGVVDVASDDEGYPHFKINYEYLKKTNSDFVGVLYIPALGLRYPVAASHNNNEYLSTTFDGKQNSSGSIFLDMNASPELTDSNSIIFGHNMKNGSMFGSLRKFLEDDTLCDTDPYIYIYMEQKVLKYRIFAYYTTPVNGSVYNGFRNAAGYDSYVARGLAASAYNTDEEFDFSSYPPLLLLSTCYGGNHVYNLVVQGVLAETFVQ